MLLKRRLVPLLACLLFTGCTLFTTTTGPQVTPAPTVITLHRGPLLVQYCVDDTSGNSGGYPRQDFMAANAFVAQNWIQAVAPDSDSMVMYASLITSTTYDPSNTQAPFVVPPIGAYPTLPTPVPTPAQANPVSYSATATASANQNTAGIEAYNAAMAQTTNDLAQTKSKVTSDVHRLITWNPAVDPGQASIWGCLQLARQRFAGQPGTKYLIIASQMVASSNVDYTPEISSPHALAGVHVHVIFRANCTDAEDCLGWTSTWTRDFKQAGAASIRFDDPAATQAITNLFGGA
jgi:hypothetical protein